MTVEELLVCGKSYVHKQEAEMLLSILLNVNSLELLLMLDKVVDQETSDKYQKQILMLKKKGAYSICYW